MTRIQSLYQQAYLCLLPLFLEETKQEKHHRLLVGPV
jgi:hypothetical protein